MTTESIELLRGLPITGASGAVAGVTAYLGPYYPQIDRMGAKPIVIEATGDGTVQLLRQSTAIAVGTFANGSAITVGGQPLGPWNVASLQPVQQQEWSEWATDAVFYLALTPSAAVAMNGSIRQ